MEEKRFNPGFPQDKAKVLRAVSRVDVHLNDSGTRAGQEKENPLGATAGPYTDAVSGTQALPDQAARRFFDALFQFAIRQPGVSMPHDEGFVRGLARGHLRKRFEDSLLAKRELGPSGVAWLRHFSAKGGLYLLSRDSPVNRFLLPVGKISPNQLLPREVLAARTAGPG